METAVIRRHILGRIEFGAGEQAQQEPLPRPDVCAQACPSRAILELIADKWALLVLHALRPSPMRNGELMRAIGGVSQKMLTQTLRNLERDGLINRQAFATVPVTVEYSLTPLGETLVGPVSAIRDWAEGHIEEVLAAQAKSEARRAAELESRP